MATKKKSPTAKAANNNITKLQQPKEEKITPTAPEKFLSIIIPHYSETEKEVFPLLASIVSQVGVDFSDFEVIISNDGNCYKLPDSFIKLFSDTVSIRQIWSKENVGPGLARQYGIDNSNAEYVMFCDADDCLHSVGALGALISEARNVHPNILTSEWIEEMVVPDQENPQIGHYVYITHRIENTWMHGKLIRRQLLIDHDIKFHDELRVHEDSYFLSMAMAAAQAESEESARHIAVITYVWKYRPESITRRNNGNYTFNDFPTFLHACCMSFAKIEKIYPQRMEYNIVQLLIYTYFTMQMPEWTRSENAKYVKRAEMALIDEIRPFWKYWYEAAPEMVARVYNEEREKNFTRVGGVENITLDDWIKHILDLSSAMGKQQYIAEVVEDNSATEEENNKE